MSFWYEARINADYLGVIEVRRIEHLDLTDRAAIADTVSTYEVKLDGRLLSTVKHRYGDGWKRLNRLAAELIDEVGRG
jgi:hypothetical protein